MMVFNAIISFSGLPVGRGPKEVMLSKCFLALLATNPIVYQNDFRCIEYCIANFPIKISKGAEPDILPSIPLFAFGKCECAFSAIHQLKIRVMARSKTLIALFCSFGAIIVA